MTANSIAKRINGICDLVDVMKDLPQLDAPVKHYFSLGVYAREITMPVGMLLVGKIHKTKHLNILSSGSVVVVTAARRLELTAPHTFESFEGEQKIIYALTEAVWTTIHATEETDLAKIEEECITEEYNKDLVDTLIQNIGGQQCLG